MPLLISSTFIYLIYQYGSFSSFLFMTENLDFLLVSVALGLLVLSLLIRAARIRRFFKKETKSLGVMRITFLHNFLNNFLPMRIGEFSFPLLLRESYGIDNKISLRALFIFRITDLLSIIFLSLFVFLSFYYSLMLNFLILVASLTKFNFKLSNFFWNYFYKYNLFKQEHCFNSRKYRYTKSFFLQISIMWLLQKMDQSFKR